MSEYNCICCSRSLKNSCGASDFMWLHIFIDDPNSGIKVSFWEGAILCFPKSFFNGVNAVSYYDLAKKFLDIVDNPFLKEDIIENTDCNQIVLPIDSIVSVMLEPVDDDTDLNIVRFLGRNDFKNDEDAEKDLVYQYNECVHKVITILLKKVVGPRPKKNDYYSYPNYVKGVGEFGLNQPGDPTTWTPSYRRFRKENGGRMNFAKENYENDCKKYDKKVESAITNNTLVGQVIRKLGTIK